MYRCREGTKVLKNGRVRVYRETCSLKPPPLLFRRSEARTCPPLPIEDHESPPRGIKEQDEWRDSVLRSRSLPKTGTPPLEMALRSGFRRLAQYQLLARSICTAETRLGSSREEEEVRRSVFYLLDNRVHPLSKLACRDHLATTRGSESCACHPSDASGGASRWNGGGGAMGVCGHGCSGAQAIDRHEPWRRVSGLEWEEEMGRGLSLDDRYGGWVVGGMEET
ncbi:hypothetical protein BJ875DRAFT_443152 [Amylocarpus encephaloides]|uniref:Uncharacterized protein n=1 Tax=Amylocarpus encephaloides TaxID=45428 RepID=A0A9P8C4W9_9HELO|nr:hypothetical protein BJ875DRAFT_443152 [Amylocarpus encephaloides]